MELAARNGLWSVQARDLKGYVESGLMAMWDGIDNAAIGDENHDPNAEKWVDLVSGIEILPGRITSHVRANSFYVDARNTTRPFYETTVPGLADARNTAFTFEVLNFNDILSANYSEMFTIGGTPLLRNGNYEVITRHYGEQIRFTGIVSTSGVPDVFTFATSGRNWKTYVNGVQSNEGTVNGTTDYTSDYFAIGNKNNNYYIFPGSIRLYNRQLTGSEVSANYSVDVARFNLT